MESLTQFFAMGGYGGFVWPSYLLAALLLAVVFLMSWRAARSNEQQLKALQATRPDRGRRESPEEA